MRALAVLFVCFLAVSALLSSCAGGIVPQTGTERYIAADGAYKALLLTVKDGVVRGTIKGQAAADISIALTSIKIALDVWALVPNDPNAEAVAIAALSAAQSILRAVGTHGAVFDFDHIFAGGHRDGVLDLNLREYAI